MNFFQCITNSANPLTYYILLKFKYFILYAFQIIFFQTHQIVLNVNKRNKKNKICHAMSWVPKQSWASFVVVKHVNPKWIHSLWLFMFMFHSLSQCARNSLVCAMCIWISISACNFTSHIQQMKIKTICCVWMIEMGLNLWHKISYKIQKIISKKKMGKIKIVIQSTYHRTPS